MPQARITINAVIGSETDLPINTPVQLDNVNVGGETSFLWEILDQPAGTADVLSSPTIQNPVFTPQKEGTYLVRLTVNQGLPDQDIDSVVGSVLLIKTRRRVPAAGEQTEASTSRGWATDTNAQLRFINDSIADPGTLVAANLDASPIAKGTVVRATGIQTLKLGLPGQEEVTGVTPAPATVGGNVNELLLVAESDIDGLTSIPAGGLGIFRFIGRIADIPLGAGAVGDDIFVSDTATLSTTAGTIRRQVGSIMAVDGVDRDIWFAGTQGGDNAPIDPPYVVYGSPGVLPNATRIDGLNATGAINSTPYTFRAGDVATVALVAKRFSGAGADPFQVHDDIGTIQAGFHIDGELFVNTAGADITGQVDVTGSIATLTGGIRVGFAGASPANQMQVGDAVFRMQLDATPDAIIHFDSGNDRLFYNRLSDLLLFQIGGVTEWVTRSTGFNIANGLVMGNTSSIPTSGDIAVETGGITIGFTGTDPSSGQLFIGDANFMLQLDGALPSIIGDVGVNDRIQFDRTTNHIEFLLGGTESTKINSTGMTVAGLRVGTGLINPTTNDLIVDGGISLSTGLNPVTNRLIITDADFHLDFNGLDPLLSFDSGPDQIRYDISEDDFLFEIGNVVELLVSTDGLRMPAASGIHIGDTATAPANNAISIGGSSVDFRMDFDGSDPEMHWDTNDDFMRYSRTNDRWDFFIANSIQFQISDVFHTTNNYIRVSSLAALPSAFVPADANELNSINRRNLIGSYGEVTSAGGAGSPVYNVASITSGPPITITHDVAVNTSDAPTVFSTKLAQAGEAYMAQITGDSTTAVSFFSLLVAGAAANAPEYLFIRMAG